MTESELMDVLTECGVDRLTIRSRNIHGCCPFHSESRPSWGIRIDEPHVHGCFSCGASGNIFTLLRHFGKLGSTVAMKALADLPAAAMDTEFKLQTFTEAKESEEFIPKERMYPYQFTKECVRFFKSRGIRPATAKAVGCAYDHKTHRIMFPWKVDGEVRVVTGRALRKGDSNKIIAYFESEKSKWLYIPGGTIRDEEVVIMVEGETDALKVYDAGGRNVVALGHGRFSKGAANLVLNSEPRVVVLFFDDDEAGQRLTKDASEILGQTKAIHHVNYALWRRKYSKGKIDPGRLTRADIREALFRTVRYANWSKF